MLMELRVLLFFRMKQRVNGFSDRLRSSPFPYPFSGSVEDVFIPLHRDNVFGLVATDFMASLL